MPKGKTPSSKPTTNRRRPPAKTPEGRENQLIQLAINLVEQRLIDGTASSQETTHFLKLASSENRLKQKLLEKEVELATAKTEQIQSQKRVEELYANALTAMKTYQGRGGEDD